MRLKINIKIPKKNYIKTCVSAIHNFYFSNEFKKNKLFD